VVVQVVERVGADVVESVSPTVVDAFVVVMTLDVIVTVGKVKPQAASDRPRSRTKIREKRLVMGSILRIVPIIS